MSALFLEIRRRDVRTMYTVLDLPDSLRDFSGPVVRARVHWQPFQEPSQIMKSR